MLQTLYGLWNAVPHVLPESCELLHFGECWNYSTFGRWAQTIGQKLEAVTREGVRMF